MTTAIANVLSEAHVHHALIIASVLRLTITLQ